LPVFNQYLEAENILLLCDADGANSYRHHIFKKEMMRFAGETGLPVIVCHCLPYSSMWNPAEYRLFCHVHKAMDGVVFSDCETVRKSIGQTSTGTGQALKQTNQRLIPKESCTTRQYRN
jgi:hypothetical protein